MVATPSLDASFVEIIVPSFSTAVAVGGVIVLSTIAVTVSVPPLL